MTLLLGDSIISNTGTFSGIQGSSGLCNPIQLSEFVNSLTFECGKINNPRLQPHLQFIDMNDVAYSNCCSSYASDIIEAKLI